jgi:hypothetical protein
MTDVPVEPWGTYFGEPWPSGVCEDSLQVATPVGTPCVMCEEPIQDGDRGTFIGVIAPVTNGHPAYGPVHRECSLRAVLGGIGHLENHHYWCKERRDPDGGRSYRVSALLVWDWVHRFA